MHVDGGHRQKPIDFQQRLLKNGRLVAILDFFGFQTLTFIWLWMSTPNLSGTIHIYICVGAYWFSATSLSKWPPGGHIGFFGCRINFTLALNINSKLQWHNTYLYGYEPVDFQWPHFLNGCLVAILYFSVSARHGFGSVTQVCFGISVSNFMCMSFVAVGRSIKIVSYGAFKMTALWFWTMFPLQSTHWPLPCHPLLWGGCILVNHWSTISS